MAIPRAPSYLTNVRSGFCILDSYIAYLEGHGDLVSRLKIGIIGVTIMVIGAINLLTKSP